MDKLKILIADPSGDFREALADALKDLHHVRTVSDGVQALQMLRSYQPDMLVLDLMMPGIDGITLLQRAAESGCKPMVLATTCYLSDYIISSVQQLGVGFIMIKPCLISAITARLSDLSQRLQQPVIPQPDPKAKVSSTLLRLGIPTKLRGYSYLRQAVLLMAKDPAQSVTKELYPAVAAQFGATAIQVERSIRSAVQAAWEHCDPQIWQLYFPAGETGLIPRPTNAGMISRLADILLLQESAPNIE